MVLPGGGVPGVDRHIIYHQRPSPRPADWGDFHFEADVCDCRSDVRSVALL